MSSKDLVPTAESGLVEISKRIEKVNSSLEDMDEAAITHRIKNFRSLMDKKNTYERALSNLIVEKERSTSSLKEIGTKISSLEDRKKKYYENEKIAEEISKLEKRRRSLERDLSSSKKSLGGCEDRMYELIEHRGSCEQRISFLTDRIEERQRLRSQYTAYDLFKVCMDSNGIGSDIIKKCLPVINEEIAKILVDIVPFEIFFEIEERKLEIYIRHPKHEPRLIEMASGAEKTIAAMAIRLALTKIGNLPTSDIFILDEPATALDADNMDGFIDILEMLKNQFKTVILISHLDVLKECVDSEIVIDKKNGFAHVEI